jgi:hypothetical protein
MVAQAPSPTLTRPLPATLRTIDVGVPALWVYRGFRDDKARHPTVCVGLVRTPGRVYQLGGYAAAEGRVSTRRQPTGSRQTRPFMIRAGTTEAMRRQRAGA